MAEKIIDALYLMIVNNVSDEVCVTCPLVRIIRDLNETLRDASSEEIIRNLGLTFNSMDCPCITHSE